jgi:hypothetical protein
MVRIRSSPWTSPPHHRADVCHMGTFCWVFLFKGRITFRQMRNGRSGGMDAHNSRTVADGGGLINLTATEPHYRWIDDFLLKNILTVLRFSLAKRTLRATAYWWRNVRLAFFSQKLHRGDEEPFDPLDYGRTCSWQRAPSNQPYR